VQAVIVRMLDLMMVVIGDVMMKMMKKMMMLMLMMMMTVVRIVATMVVGARLVQAKRRAAGAGRLTNFTKLQLHHFIIASIIISFCCTKLL